MNFIKSFNTKLLKLSSNTTINIVLNLYLIMIALYVALVATKVLLVTTIPIYYQWITSYYLPIMLFTNVVLIMAIGNGNVKGALYKSKTEKRNSVFLGLVWSAISVMLSASVLNNTGLLALLHEDYLQISAIILMPALSILVLALINQRGLSQEKDNVNSEQLFKDTSTTVSEEE